MKPHVRCAALALLGAAISLLCASCASRTYEVQVHSIAHPASSSKRIESYRIRNRNPAVDDQSLRYAEAVRHIKTALSAQGLYEAPNSHSADMIVELDYGMEPAKVKYTVYNVPVFGRKGTEIGSVAESLDASNKELVGYQPEVFQITVREKRLSVCARENQPRGSERPPEEFWRVDVSIEDKSHDLRGYLPILASAAMDQIGRNSEGEESAVISAEDEAVQFVKKGM